MVEQKSQWPKVVENAGKIAVALTATIGLIVAIARLSSDHSSPTPPHPNPGPALSVTASPLQTIPTVQAVTLGNPNVQVWANTYTHKYHCFGSKWYGKTIHGGYMSQKQAQESGFQPAYGKVCN